MYQIREWLYVGNIGDTLNLPALREASIGAMLQLYEAIEQPGVDTLFIQLEEGVPIDTDDLEQALGFIAGQRAQQQRVLVACGAGISRSVVIATAALKEAEGGSLFDAYNQIRQRHPAALPDQIHWLGVCRHYNDAVSYKQLWQGILDS
jgi:protein-tyrosine phosphatase